MLGDRQGHFLATSGVEQTHGQIFWVDLGLIFWDDLGLSVGQSEKVEPKGAIILFFLGGQAAYTQV